MRWGCDPATANTRAGIMLAAWCELRGDFRHFRNNRLEACALAGEGFPERSAALRRMWQENRAAVADYPLL
ncbi:MAG: hypothetical protein QHC90_25640 [Shinella sp.]|jgi:predicted DNA-binding transcriptional regulator YafY|nr:hypothetical protein [Shinella sp.]